MIVKHRRGTTKEWQKFDLIPEEGELVLEERKGGAVKCKVGDGVRRFSELPYIDDETRRDLLKEIAEIESVIADKQAALQTSITTMETDYVRFNSKDSKFYVGSDGSDEIIFDCGSAPTKDNN
jgi:hypothetical protein